jgi:hypothetical protein
VLTDESRFKDGEPKFSTGGRVPSDTGSKVVVVEVVEVVDVVEVVVLVVVVVAGGSSPSNATQAP